jgi:tetratricopeptide (TPR) repeat protein
MSAVVESERESVYCLRSVVKLNPGHHSAKLGLAVLGQVSSGVERSTQVKQSRSIPFPHQSAGRINSMGEWWKISRNRENAVLSILGVAAAVILVTIVLFRFPISALSASFAAGPQTTSIASPTSSGAAAVVTNGPTPTFRQSANPSSNIPFDEFVGVHPSPTPIYAVTPMPSSGAFDLGLQAMAAGNYSEALSDFQQVIYADPCSAEAHYFIGEILRLQRQMGDSYTEYQKATECDPNYAPAYLGLALWSKQSNPANDYLDDIERALQLDPNYVDAYLERAAWYVRQDDWETARGDLERANLIAPDNALVLIRLGRAQVQTGQADLALENLIRAQVIDPTILEGYLGLGEGYNALDLNSLAVTPLSVYTIYADQDIAGWLQLGAAYTGTGDYGKAVDACGQALQIDTNSVDGRLCRGQAYLLSLQYGNAVDDLQVAADRAPNLYAAEFALGQALVKANQPNKAIGVLQKAIDLAATTPEKADAMGWQGYAYEAINSPSAQRVWQDLMNLPDVPEFWWATAYQHFFRPNTPTPEPGSQTTDTPTPTPTPKK